MTDDLDFLDNLTIITPEERAQIERDRDPVLADAKDWAENSIMPPDRRGLLRLLINRVEHAEQVSSDAVGVSKAIVRTVAQVKRIQAEFADDLIDNNGSIYEQVKDLVEQFHVERDAHLGANVLAGQQFYRAQSRLAEARTIAVNEAAKFQSETLRTSELIREITRLRKLIGMAIADLSAGESVDSDTWRAVQREGLAPKGEHT